MWDLSSPTRGQIHVPCLARQILNHWTTREVPNEIFQKEKLTERAYCESGSPNHFAQLLCDMVSSYPLTSEETGGPERLNNLPKVTRLAGRQVKI